MSTPCADPRLPDPHDPIRPDTCGICKLYRDEPKLRAMWDALGSKTHIHGVDKTVEHPKPSSINSRRIISLPVVDTPQCIYEGEIVEKCPSCSPDNPKANARHRRKCSHPTATYRNLTSNLLNNSTKNPDENYINNLIDNSKSNSANNVTNNSIDNYINDPLIDPIIEGICTREYVNPQITNCDDCEFRVRPTTNSKAALPPLEGTPWISTSQLVEDAKSLVALLPNDVTGIVGIPRSGMLPASIVATHAHLPLYSLSTDGAIFSIGHGMSRPIGLHDIPNKMAVIDDVIWAGTAMNNAKKSLEGKSAIFGAVYVKPGSERHADFYGRSVETLYTEWNIFNSGQMSVVALDFDGILCHDEESGGPIGKAQWLPRYTKIPLIITGRPESSRYVTEKWLEDHSIKFDRLEMMEGTSINSWQNIAEFKARHYTESNCLLFIESDEKQAERIFFLSKKRVACPKAGKIFM